MAGMDGFAALLGGAVLLVLVLAFVALQLGIGEQFLEPIIALLGKPFILVSRRINEARRERAIRKLPPDIPPPPRSP